MKLARLLHCKAILWRTNALIPYLLPEFSALRSILAITPSYRDLTILHTLILTPLNVHGENGKHKLVGGR